MSLRRHPFEKFFEQALKKSASDPYAVENAAVNLRDKGYPPAEIHAALQHFHRTLIVERDSALVKEALSETATWVDYR